MQPETSAPPDILEDLRRLVDEAAPVNGPALRRAEVAALALLAAEEIEALRKAGDHLSLMAQTSGAVPGPDALLIEAIGEWQKARGK